MLGGIKSYLRRRRDFQRLANSPMARAVIHSRKISAIEAERSRLSKDRNPLISNCEPGPFDEQTVAAANLASREPNGCSLLYGSVKAAGARTVLELGTNLGISSAYLAYDGAAVTTLDASQCRQAQARKVHANLGLTNVEYVHGFFVDTLQSTLDRLPPIDLAYIDGHHKFQPTLDYFSLIRAHGHDKTVYVFDDVDYSPQMRRAWAKLQQEFTWSGEAFGIGIGLYADL